MTDPRDSVHFDNDEIRSEYERWMGKIAIHDPYTSNTIPGLKAVLRAHFLIVAYFYGKGTGLGGIGPKSVDLLHSALYRPVVSLGGVEKWKTHYEKAATLIYGII